ncbi:hypothetical protein [Proteus terrae]|uniref:hypothetical protein n=1 Tax=Proteus terrae TaxID=1574161 RepID=UPI00301C9027
MSIIINNQQSTINNQQSTINNQQSTINNQQSTMYAYGTRQSTEFYWSFPFHQPIILK